MSAKPSNIRELVESTGAVIDNWFYDQSNPAYASNQQLLNKAIDAMYGSGGGNLDSFYSSVGSGQKTAAVAPNVMNVAATPSSTGGLTPDIARNLMQRSMTTGVPTSEFDKYGGYDAVAALYNQGGGTYSLEDLSPDFLDQMDDIIANSGVGNLSVLKQTGTPLTEAGRQAMINNGVSWTNDDLKAMGIPYEGFLQKPTVKPTAPTGGTNVGGLQPGSSSFDQAAPSNASGGWNDRRVVGAADGRLLGAGNADYNSSLIKSLRQSSLTPFSNNAGIQMLPNQGMATSNWTPPSGSDAAFSPSILSPRLATDQEVTDWNAYQTYKTNSVGAKTPILSMEEWIAKGRSDGKPVAQTPVYDPYFVFDGA